jgi:hypothetical protein
VRIIVYVQGPWLKFTKALLFTSYYCVLQKLPLQHNGVAGQSGANVLFSVEEVHEKDTEPVFHPHLQCLPMLHAKEIMWRMAIVAKDLVMVPIIVQLYLTKF